jgi:iron complex outermembrane receptor protein
MATYHGRNDDWANRIQVLVDGRSVYSGLLQGSAGIGWQTLALDDIERIEVLRGSNSATYGARAFLGVVNIISRDVRETIGTSASVARGENGIADAGASIGWNAMDAHFRLSADSVSDDGLKGAFGKNHTERLNFSSHFALEQGAELDLRAGGMGIYSGRGDLTDTAGNPARMWFVGSQYLQADWRQALDDNQDLSLSVSHTENASRDRFAYLTHTGTPDYYGASVDFSGDEYVDTFTAQHTLRLSPTLRTVWGGEFRHERVVAPALFDTTGGASTDFYRLFGSAEWRLSETLLLNAGALAEHSNADGDSVSPRLMLNWRIAPGHTLRAGASTAFRPPSAYEKWGQVQYRDVNGQNPTGYYIFNNGSLVPEKLLSQELGYYFAPANTPFSGDVRIFKEQISDGIVHTEHTTPGTNPQKNLNDGRDEISGFEWQLNWQPSSATRVYLTQSWTDTRVMSAIEDAPAFRTAHGAPRYAASLTLMHSFADGWHASVMHQQADDVALMSISDSKWLFSMQRTDLRLAKDLHLGRKKAELGLLLQNLGDPFQDGDYKFRFEQRALLTLKIEN